MLELHCLNRSCELYCFWSLFSPFPSKRLAYLPKLFTGDRNSETQLAAKTLQEKYWKLWLRKKKGLTTHIEQQEKGTGAHFPLLLKIMVATNDGWSSKSLDIGCLFQKVKSNWKKSNKLRLTHSLNSLKQLNYNKIWKSVFFPKIITTFQIHIKIYINN